MAFVSPLTLSQLTTELDNRFRSEAFEGSAGGGTVLTAGAAAAKGAWVQLIASSSRRYTHLVLILFDANLANSTYQMDLGTGAAAAEVVLIPDVNYLQESLVGHNVQFYYFKVNIPSGIRIAGRISAVDATNTIAAKVIGIG